MALITWSTDLSVNVKGFDEEHKKLINMVNDLHSAMGAGKSKEAMEKILTGLVDYTKTHFAAEEQLMQKHNYPGYQTHKAQHVELTTKVVDFQNKLHNGKAIVSMDVMTFLKDWLSNHIMTIDKKYGPYMNEKGVL